METPNRSLKVSRNDVLQVRVSYQLNVWSPISKEISIKDVLMEISSDSYSTQVKYLRQLLHSGNQDAYDTHKVSLPAVTFCASFDASRQRSSIKQYHSLMVLDIDKLSEEELNRIKECMYKDEFVFTYWESPSQNGIKGLVHLRYESHINKESIDVAHKSAFKILKKYFFDSYNIVLDNSGSDTTRLCFLSYDPKLVLKDSIVSFNISEADILSQSPTKKSKTTDKEVMVYQGDRDILFNPKGKNDPRHRNTIQAIIKFLIRKNLSVTESYEDWFKVALAIANSFTYEIGEKYFLRLSALDPQKFDVVKCKNMLIHCYHNRRGKVNFSTIIFLARTQGYQKNKRKESSETAEVLS